MPNSRPTSFDIAYLAGVSQPTVSRALRGSPAVSAKTREKIERIARELNYTVDRNASSLRSQRANTLALLLFEDDSGDESNINPFFQSMLGTIIRESSRRGYDLLVSFQQTDDNWHARYQDSRRADGIILLGYGDFRDHVERLEALKADGTQFVRWGPQSDDMAGITLGSDNIGAGRIAGEHLIGCGRKHIAFLGTATPNFPEFHDRYAGFCTALGEGQSPPQFEAMSSEEDGYRAAQQMLTDYPECDAVFAASDLIAIGAMRAMREAGKQLPQDIAIVGFDNIASAALTNPALTTVMQDAQSAGRALVRSLIAAIEGQEVEPAILPTRLIVRESCGSHSN
ncbi:LacI family DNA-binding transcriptional regulator [Alterisphingorhabdus coralli]|uniref:LacI family DNA-binding transcriptional regulator n=1 Tax=Alterisphingorhabdus coralli TaxID=3071408 RepID=A0AA97F7B9_9SPHN|nr:LacI family DNA-binding transcriptional regulator [Parasphingorhabdus sp. SCSIO 66989]WOE75521.1 LacI family DNA-binding transcriptional regulator [Parasphingorhabdus sp. SCSIO 66989]